MITVAVFGTRSFGAAAAAAVAGHPAAELVAVVSPAGDDPLTAAARRAPGLWIPADTFTAEQLPDVGLILAAHSHNFIGRRTRARARIGAAGYHPSLLPRHRGRDAVRWTIHLRDPIAGGTIYWLTDNVDAGPVAAQDWCHVLPGDTPTTLWRRDLFPMGVDLVRRWLDDVAAGVIRSDPQLEAAATWEPSWDRPPVHRPELIELGPMPAGYTLTRKERTE